MKINYKKAHDDLKAHYLNLLKELAEESREREHAEERAQRMENVLNATSKRLEYQYNNALVHAVGAHSEAIRTLNRRLNRIPLWIQRLFK